MNSTTCATHASSSRCSATCARAMTQARAVFQVASCNCSTARITLKMIGMRVSSSNVSANLSRFSSPMPTASPSHSSSSLSFPSFVHNSTSSSTSSIHETFTFTTASSKGKPSAFDTSSSKPKVRAISASIALCLTSSSPKASPLHDAICSKVSDNSLTHFASLKNSGSDSTAAINPSKTSFKSSSVSGVAKACKVATRAEITSTTGAAVSLSRSSTISRATCAAAARTSGAWSASAAPSICAAWAP
mmetsp:Transcript_29413/g.73873  ORF Transcript_29413/g.73873 Transcript_29413/m.73873 type:complete len:247 (+) Transcript_29413:2170-2910(+)